VKRLLLILCAIIASGFALASPIVHTERMRVGSENIAVGFSIFPPGAEQSLDWTFAPESGIVGKKGTVTFIKPDGTPYEYITEFPLPRFIRDRNVWGIDSMALPLEGQWKIEIKLEGIGTGRLPITLLPRPAGPPSNVIWVLTSVPVLALLLMGARAWIRVRPLRLAGSRSWHD
jgi:hypothetical protein